MPRNRSDRADLRDDLKNDLAFAAEYLSAAYADSRQAFLVALRDIVEAQKGVGQLARDAEINRENLYRMLSKEGNPRLTSLRPVLGILGIGVQFTAIRRATSVKREAGPRRARLRN